MVTANLKAMYQLILSGIFLICKDLSISTNAWLGMLHISPALKTLKLEASAFLLWINFAYLVFVIVFYFLCIPWYLGILSPFSFWVCTLYGLDPIYGLDQNMFGGAGLLSQ